MTKAQNKPVTEKSLNEAVEAIMGGIDGIYEKLDEKIENSKNDLSMQIDSLDRKFVSQQNRLDTHNDRIETLEKIHPKGKHDFITV